MNDFQRRLLDAVQNSAWIAAVARKDREILGIDYYTYTSPSIAGLAVGATTQVVIPIQSDSDFALTYMSGSVVVGGVVVNNPVSTLQITDTGTGKTFFSAPTLFGLVMGSSGTPFYLPAPRVIAPNTNINLSVTNVAGAGAADYFMSLLGARIYYAS